MISFPPNLRNADIPSEQIGKVMYAEFRVGSVRMAAKDTVDCAEGNTDRQLMVTHQSSQMIPSA